MLQEGKIPWWVVAHMHGEMVPVVLGCSHVQTSASWCSSDLQSDISWRAPRSSLDVGSALDSSHVSSDSHRLAISYDFLHFPRF